MNKERLLQLADHLENGELGHDDFKFNTYNSSNFSQCGSSGCAIGECPVIWPENWVFNEDGHPVLNGYKKISNSIEDWFDLHYDESDHLFLPEGQICDKYGGYFLYDNATKEQVASNILEFVRRLTEEASA